MKKQTAKSRVVGKHPHHAKQTSPSAAHLQAEINALKRAVSALSKHHQPPKKHHAKPHKHHHHHHHVKRGLALGDMAACCAAEALAASLRLSGRPVADEDVLALYARTAADLDEGASILETLEAAWLYGLGGVRPAAFEAVESETRGVAPPAGIGPLQVPLFTGAHIPTATLSRHRPADTASISLGTSLILGLELPGPHTVLATPDGWWSWGELHDPSEFPDAVIEEAWEIRWPSWL